MTLESRFLAKIGNRDGCWEWTAFKDKAGYARIGLGRDNVLYAHRVSYELYVGAIPDGAVIDHKCRNRGCVNPDHLHAVTHSQNLENLGGANVSNKSSGIRNVHFHKASGLWYVRVCHQGTSHHRGYFKDIRDAERAAIELRNALFSNNLIDRGESA